MGISLRCVCGPGAVGLDLSELGRVLAVELITTYPTYEASPTWADYTLCLVPAQLLLPVVGIRLAIPPPSRVRWTI